MLKKLRILVSGMNNRFPKGNTPYQITTRILEECGEVASEVNHIEGSGTKNERYGTASKEKLASEIKDAMNALIQLALYYDVVNDVENAVEKAIVNLTNEGYINKEH